MSTLKLWNEKKTFRTNYQFWSISGLGLKRCFDTVVSIVIMIAISPLVIFIVACIYIVDPGPVFFAHHRVGRNGRLFPCLKFRSMVVDAEARLEAVLVEDQDARAEWEKSQKLRKDPRILPVIGTFLRRSSLDELPQILNVIRGDMSLVGPRPVTQAELERHYGANAHFYRRVRPGLSGLWQVSGRSKTSFEERVQMDVRYVKNMSFLNDMKIAIKTPFAVLGGSGAC